MTSIIFGLISIIRFNAILNYHFFTKEIIGKEIVEHFDEKKS